MSDDNNNPTNIKALSYVKHSKNRQQIIKTSRKTPSEITQK